MTKECRCTVCLCWKAIKSPLKVCDLCRIGNHPGDPR
jgi:hypothetical protein